MPIPGGTLDLSGTPQRADVERRLVDAVVAGDLAPGARLVEAELCRQFDAPLAAIRDAIAKLALLGLAVVEPRRATYVAPVDPEHVAQTAVVIGEIATEAILEATPRLTDGDRERLRAYRADALGSTDQLRRALRESRQRELYDVFYARAGNPDLDRVRTWLSPTMARFGRLHTDRVDVEATRRNQRATIRAALAGDGQAAATAFRATVLHLEHEAATSPRTPDDPTDALPRSPLIRDRATDAIRDALLDGTLVPGEPLRESELMRWLGISRTPVRNALRTLTALGLVVQRYHQPARVATLDRAGVVAALRAVGALRRLSLRLACARDREAVLAVFTEAIDAQGSGRHGLLGLVGRTGDEIAPISGNAVLAETLARLSTRVRWYAMHEPAILGPGTVATLREVRAAVAADDIAAAEAVLDTLFTVDPDTLTVVG
ncbi:GntR family transcriptional regulator [Cellulomonas alba]|uniref:GntR family transcriptional regulator n=1 Tax=Cellulomonas alba TaxID=3053467 RepID=A0ABT7SIY0_9CELL|nr:GntR family transcriptional regulator [Cellulomonas alba]MDM7855512.1 GntR family transcriptional regulator [Cellulomonas alba]